MSRKRDTLKKYHKILEIIIVLSKFIPSSFYHKLLKTIRHKDSYLVMLIRYICLKNLAKSCGDNVAIFSNVYLLSLQNLEIGDNVSIHPLSYIDASGGISIGSDVSIAHNTTILSEEHIYDDLMRNIKDQGYLQIATFIEDNVWIGAGSRILAGSCIESGSVVGSGAVVKKRVYKNSIVGGVPAKVIKERY